MLILIVWVSKFNESTFYIIKLLVIYNVQFVCSGWYIVFVIDFKIKVLVELFLLIQIHDMHVCLLIKNGYRLNNHCMK